MTSESGGRAVVIAPSALGSKDLPAGLSIVPLRESARRSTEEDPSAECGEGSVARF